MKKIFKYLIVSAFSAQMIACGGSGGSSSSDQENEIIPASFGSASRASWTDENKLFEVEIDFDGYLPERLNNTNIAIEVDADDSGALNLGDFTINLFQERDCNESGNICSLSIEGNVIYASAWGDARGFSYRSDNSSGHAKLTITLYDILLANTRRELIDNSFSVRVSVVELEDHGSENVVSSDFAPSESAFYQMMGGDDFIDPARDYAGTGNSADIVSVKVTNFVVP